MWHRRLGHVSFNTLKSLMKIPVSGDMKCVVCAEGKHARSPFSENGTRATKLLGIIHTDVCGPFPVQSLGSAKYFVPFIDDYSRRVCIYPLKSKAEVFSKFVAYKKMVENQLESTIKIVRSDNGTEYVNKNFEQLFAECGIKHEKSTPHSPQQNGLSERMNRTILEKTRCMLLDSRLPKHFWAEAAQAAVNVINTLPNSPNGAAPDEMWYNKKCNLKHFRVFGSKAMVWKPNMKRGKLDAKSFECIYLRRADDAKAFRLYDKNARKIVISHDVIFMENEAKVIDSNCVTKSSEVFIENDECFDEISDVEEITISTVSDVSAPAATGENDNSVSSNADDVNNTLVTDNQNESESMESTFESTTSSTTENDNHAPGSSNGTLAIDNADDTMNRTTVDAGALDDRARDPDFRTRARIDMDASRPNTRSKANNIMNLFHMAFVVGVQDDYMAFVASEPNGYKEAMKDENCKEWNVAMQEEYNSLIQNNTWELVERPPNVKTVDNKWVYKIKSGNEIVPKRFKARLVARGFTQEYGVNYYETFSPVVRFTSIRTILAIAAQKRMHIKQFDVKTAFLNGELNELVYWMDRAEFASSTRVYTA